MRPFSREDQILIFRKETMDNKLQKKIRKVEEEHAEEIVSANLSAHDERRRDETLILLGGIKAADRISSALGAETMRALIRFQNEERYKRLGFDNFVGFLNNYESSPMTKNQFYDRKALLEKEGDATFDLLNSVSMPVSKRRLLGKGNIQIEGETVIIRDGDGGEHEIELRDRTRLLETLTALADANADKSATLDKQKTKLTANDERIADLVRLLEDAKNRPGTLNSVEFFVRCVSSIDAFAEFVKQQTPVEKERDSEFNLNGIFAAFARLQAAYGRHDMSFGSEPKPENEFAAITGSMNDDELAEMMD